MDVVNHWGKACVYASTPTTERVHCLRVPLFTFSRIWLRFEVFVIVIPRMLKINCTLRSGMDSIYQTCLAGLETVSDVSNSYVINITPIQ